MRKDPTEFRKRFADWKAGKKVCEGGLPKYEDGYESFLATLPDNQKKPGAYNTRRYWELNGKPKNFAEAIGQGMYTFENDNAWHANSVAYNDKNDTYEFMKPNYHPTRWMELVYGYDKDPGFLKDWKVQYNGPMLSDRYVRREKPGLKVKGVQLPHFDKGGKMNDKIVDGGTLREVVVTGRNYESLAKQERNRQRNIAKSYLKSTPTISNIYNAAGAMWKSLPFVTTAASMNPHINMGEAPSPGMRSPKEIVKTTKNIGQLFRTDARTLDGSNLDFAAHYNRIKLFLTSDAYRARLLKYYRDKGSSIITQKTAPESRIGELLYNIETAHPTVKPKGKLVDSDGSLMSETTSGVYHPNEHTIQVADDAMNTSTPRHEMIHARSRGQAYLDNEKYKMRTKYDKDPGPYDPAPEEGYVSYIMKRNYFGDVVEQEPRVLNTLEAMLREGYDINNLSDKQIYDFLYDRPIDTHGYDTRSLIDNYVKEDIPNALRNFKSVLIPAGIGLTGYGTNKLIQTMKSE